MKSAPTPRAAHQKAEPARAPARSAPAMRGATTDALALARALGNRAYGSYVQRKLTDALEEEEIVQRAENGGNGPSDATVRAAAAEGVSTPSGPLPYLDRIQASFGRHSIGHVKGHVGDGATRASLAMDALAFAAGDHVVFAGTPDLQTAAHEAAHIVQQQAGVRLPGGVGRAGDAYQRHADAVAKAVVAGGSVEGLLGGSRSEALPSSSAKLVQRTMYTVPDYLYTLHREASEDDEWDRHWSTSLERVSRLPLWEEYRLIDDASEHDLLGLVRSLKENAKLADATFSSYLRYAADAVGWYSGFVSSGSGAGGFNTLAMVDGEMTGRPSFPHVTRELVPIRRTQHRRHIMAWHDLRAFVSLAYADRPGLVISTIRRMAEKSTGPAAEAFDEASYAVGTESESWSDEDWLKVGLFVMNGNPRNLWAGKGRINSALNTAQMHVNKDLDRTEDVRDLEALYRKWRRVDGGEVYNAVTEIAAGILDEIMRQNVWFPTEGEYVRWVKAQLWEDIVRNLQLDTMGDAAQTRIAQEKWNVLERPITRAHDIATGGARIQDLDGDQLAEILKEFMDYG